MIFRWWERLLAAKLLGREKNPGKITYLYILGDEINIYVIIELNN
jgi:hypothetical protein